MQDVKKTEETLLPVSLLCGFLGAGKTTLLKHVLETKHAEEDFKCAVIVNDMAALNIDKSLIDQSSLVQSDKAQPEKSNIFFSSLTWTPSGTLGVSKDAPLSTKLEFEGLVL